VLGILGNFSEHSENIPRTELRNYRLKRTMFWAIVLLTLFNVLSPRYSTQFQPQRTYDQQSN
ncbi:hypothetical protein ACKFKG_03120, partial [Phormidesmis sp. 146-35]